ncbi:MAG TPA: serine/threonine-protein kinase [Candidatus Lumbricidophila sp.]|nr:serine/threonine-protein kinase [Candidatus Lumbricidophila sp.]
MANRRLPSEPPRLAGFSYIRVLGSGGFSDVFLFEQNLPRRQVAVKSLLPDSVTEAAKRMFQREANLMAALSSHPSILTVFEAGIAADGRPYLVTEYCPGSLGQQYRRERLALDVVLSTGIRIASAVESAHRAGVLHRDIKPSNILTTTFGAPVLADFGIAATLAAAHEEDAAGMSIPWTAPEVLDADSAGDVASEVWSLGATVYSLLAGRSPFERVNGENTMAALSRRISKSQLALSGRIDAPRSLEAVLQRSMAKDPAQRHASALEFARDLQLVEQELGLRPTAIDVPVEQWVTGSADTDAPTALVASDARVARRTRRRVGGRSDGSHQRPQRGARRRAWRWVLPVLVGVAVVIGAVWFGLRGAGAAGIPLVTNVTATWDGESVTFDWANIGLEPGDAYVVTLDGVTQPAQRKPGFSLHSAAGAAKYCVTVAIVRDGRSGPQSSERCIERGAK